MATGEAKISDLTLQSAPAATDLLEIEQSSDGGGRKSSISSVFLSGLASTDFSKRVVEYALLDGATSVLVQDGIGSAYFWIPPQLNGFNLIDCAACVITPSTSGVPTFQIHNLTDGYDMLNSSQKLTIDINEKTSFTAATQPLIDTAHDDVATGDQIRFDCDIAGTGTKGLTFILIFKLP